MKRLAFLLPLAFALAVAPACSSSGKAKPQAPEAGKKTTPDELNAEESRKLIETARTLAGLPAQEQENKVERKDAVLVKDEATGRTLQRIPKDKTLRVVNGKLFSAILNPSIATLELVREDKDYYYVAVEEPPKDVSEIDPTPKDAAPVFVAPPEEYEVATPAISPMKLRFEEHSDGLPTSGFWRSNMAVADLTGEGSLEIVTTPPRLAGGPFRIFRYASGRWEAVPPTFATPPGNAFGYGGIAVRDVDGDGRPDVVSVRHGGGPIVSFNEGGFRFRVESRGLPREMSSRAVAVGDVDGDGRADVLAVSDSDEAAEQLAGQNRMAQATGKPQPPAPAASSSYVRGANFRAFFASADGRFLENINGLDGACYGYGLALDAAPVDGGAPFFGTGCRVVGGTGLLWEFDRSKLAFRFVGKGVVEQSALHGGVAAMTYAGKPAVVASYVKFDGRGTEGRSIRGYGLSIYYRDGSTWKRKRISKVLSGETIESQGVGTGDLNGDGLDDVVWADDSVGRVRVFFQTPRGEFEELDPALEPRYVNHSMSVKVVDVDRDGRNDVVLMFEYRTTDKSRAGGLRFFRNAG